MPYLELMNPDEAVLSAIRCGVKRRGVAHMYALALNSNQNVKDWDAIDDAIIAKWGEKGLIYIDTVAREFLGWEPLQ
jgi:hypothetical protein